LIKGKKVIKPDLLETFLDVKSLHFCTMNRSKQF